MAGFVGGVSRDQTTLFPARLDDWIGEDHVARVVDLFVDQLDLTTLGFQRHVAARTGRPSYHPAVLLKLFIYGYLNRIPSSRRLEGEAGPNVELMWLADLWKLEAEVRGKSPEARAAARQAVLAPIVAELFTLWQKTLPRISGKSKLAEALRYAIARREIFERFLKDGLIELDSNIVERAIRPQTITRKNSLFAGSEGGGRTWATIATLLQTCKMNAVDPAAWLTQTLERIAGKWPNAKLDALMPWNYQA